MKIFFSTILLLGSFAINSEAQEKSDFTQADKAYLNRLETGQAEKALTQYQKIIDENPTSAEGHWKAARVVWWLGDQAPKKKQKKEIFQQGITLGEKAVALDPTIPEAHAWLGANMGSFGEAKGVLKSLFLVKPIRKEMNKILELDPTYDDGYAYRVLGVVDYKVPGFAGGSKKRALERLTKAYNMNPNNPFSNYYLAEYFVVRKKWDQALMYLDQLDAITPQQADPADLANMQRKGRTLRKKLK